MLCNPHFTSSRWTKLQTAGGLLEDLKTFLSKVLYYFLRNKYTCHTFPPLADTMNLYPRDYFCWWISHSLKANFCSDLSTEARLHFIPRHHLVVALPQAKKCLPPSTRDGKVLPVQLCCQCAHSLSRGTGPWHSIPAQQGAARGFWKVSGKKWLLYAWGICFKHCCEDSPEVLKAKDRFKKLCSCTWREELMTAEFHSL